MKGVGFWERLGAWLLDVFYTGKLCVAYAKTDKKTVDIYRQPPFYWTA
ncbi:MAG: hypothetical protein A4E73_03095 [Syntrophaceae bacterium PtaU1.Bin231]|nr:MAG: hypothetical protein A4E73_03095 [Syntrophaceae bacterium PtaU1.Bin231]HOG16857.1 hypothetical protein [Syntrophales bacterium]